MFGLRLVLRARRDVAEQRRAGDLDGADGVMVGRGVEAAVIKARFLYFSTYCSMRAERFSLPTCLSSVAAARRIVSKGHTVHIVQEDRLEHLWAVHHRVALALKSARSLK
jgi:hypothetical protein